MKKFRKLLPALSMLLISALLMGSSTFAWFSMNTTVTATGMRVTAQTSGNLLISKDGTTYATSSISLAENTAHAYTLLPASTVNGIDFFKVDKYASTNDNFAVPDDAKTEKVTYTIGTNNDGAYVYSKKFYLKVENNSATNLIATINGVAYESAGDLNKNLAKALKVAVAVTEKSTSATTAKIYSPFNSGTLTYDAIARETAEGENIKTSGVLAKLDSNTQATSGTTVNLASMGKDKEYEVLVTVWFEGQDENCTSVNATAFTLKGVTLDIGFSCTPKTTA